MKWLLLVLAIYILYRLFTNDRKKKSQDSAVEKEQMVATGELVKDPVCGAYISPDSAVSVRDGETMHRFCSYECRDAFLREKDRLPEGAFESKQGQKEEQKREQEREQEREQKEKTQEERKDKNL